MHNNSTQDPFVSQLQAVLRDEKHQQFAPVGGRSKTALIPQTLHGQTVITHVELSDYQGIVTYDPSEFLISARAGTTIAELQSALSQHGQYLPFDPLFSRQGATLGGTIASGISGPDRMLYGGSRDFIMEIAMLDGLGNLVRGGGKVVKNAAGFDTPKMMVGSCGRMGIIVEATLKVFPSPQSSVTLVFDNASPEDATGMSQRILSKPFPIAGMDLTPESQLVVRLSGPSGALLAAAQKIELLTDRKSLLLTNQLHVERQQLLYDWFQSIGREEALVRVALSASQAPQLSRLLINAGQRNFIFCSGGCTAWIQSPLPGIEGLSKQLRQQSLSGLVIRGCVEEPAIGDLSWQQMASRIQSAVDPNGKFKAWGSQKIRP